MRSVWKFPFFDKHVFKVVSMKKKSISIIRSRRSMFFFSEPVKLAIYDGRSFVIVDYSYSHIYSYLNVLQFGQFCFTKKRSSKIHKFNVLHLKNVKKKRALLVKSKKNKTKNTGSKDEKSKKSSSSK